MGFTNSNKPATTAKSNHVDMPKGDIPHTTFLKSFYFAGQGIWHVILTQRNMRIHLIAGVLVIVAGIIFKINWTEWSALLTIIALVFSMEMLNTVAESIVDMITREYHPLAKIAKDAAAGAVLVSALFSVGVGSVIFLPRIINWLFG